MRWHAFVTLLLFRTTICILYHLACLNVKQRGRQFLRFGNLWDVPFEIDCIVILFLLREQTVMNGFLGRAHLLLTFASLLFFFVRTLLVLLQLENGWAAFVGKSKFVALKPTHVQKKKKQMYTSDCVSQQLQHWTIDSGCLTLFLIFIFQLRTVQMKTKRCLPPEYSRSNKVILRKWVKPLCFLEFLLPLCEGMSCSCHN